MRVWSGHRGAQAPKVDRMQALAGKASRVAEMAEGRAEHPAKYPAPGADLAAGHGDQRALPMLVAV